MGNKDNYNNTAEILKKLKKRRSSFDFIHWHHKNPVMKLTPNQETKAIYEY